MWKLLILLSTLGEIAFGSWLRDASPLLDGRIVGGQNANIEDLPYQLSLQAWGSHTCGASIISANWAITAAHCVSGSSASRISLRAGSSKRGSGGSVHQAAQIIAHGSFNSRTLDYDYALVRVSTPFPLGKAGVKAIQLADSEPSAGTVATASGWGTLSAGGSLPTQLQRVSVPIIARATCQNKYRNYDITKRMICAGVSEGGKDSCQGDSGGPLAAGGRLIGIVSWGLGCASPNYPGVYTNVAEQRAWIKQNSGSWPPEASPQLDGRIVGGQNASIEDLPYQLSLQIYGSHICGASIISANWAITAAHCVSGNSASTLSLRAGSSTRGSGGSVHQVAQISAHSRFNPGTLDYDYALVRVSTPFPLGEAGVEAIQLADSEPSAGTVATASGWGTLVPGGSLPVQLQMVEVPVIERATCEDKYRGRDITKRMICAGMPEGGKDGCQGDSGGPFATGGRLVGIVSWGIGCATPNYPGVYANVAEQRAWIRDISGV